MVLAKYQVDCDGCLVLYEYSYQVTYMPMVMLLSKSAQFINVVVVVTFLRDARTLKNNCNTREQIFFHRHFVFGEFYLRRLYM